MGFYVMIFPVFFPLEREVFWVLFVLDSLYFPVFSFERFGFLKSWNVQRLWGIRGEYHLEGELVLHLAGLPRC